MSLKKYKPTTPGLRHKISLDNANLWKKRPEKSLTMGMKSSGGRNNYGRMTIKGIGGGVKKLYRQVDFKRNIVSIACTGKVDLNADFRRRTRKAV